MGVVGFGDGDDDTTGVHREVEGWLDWAEPEPGDDLRTCNARYPAPRHVYLWDPHIQTWTYLTVDSSPPSRD